MKSDVDERIRYVETNFEVEKIKYKDIYLWPYIRTIVFSRYEIQGGTSEKKNNKNFFQLFLQFLLLAKHLIESFLTTDFSLFFKKNSTILFTDSMETRFINGKPISKIENGLIKLLERNIVPIYQVKKNTKPAFKHYINRGFIDFRFVLKPVITKIDANDIKGVIIFNDICQYLNIKLDLLKTIKKYILIYNFYLKLFSKMRPVLVVINCYYEFEKLGMISAAKQLKIPVIEMQHGHICLGHIAYTSYKKFDKNPYSDFLFCFGEVFKKFVSNEIYPQKNIKIVGSYYIDFIRKNKNENKILFDKKFSKLTKDKIVITVLSQWTIDLQLLDFYFKVAKANPDLYIIFKVRPFENYHKNYMNLLSNFTIETELDTYVCMQNSDITSTVNSTCAEESLALGVPVILVNIDNLAVSTMKPFFGDNLTSVDYVDNIDDISKSISRLLHIPKVDIEKEGANFFSFGHEKLLKTALDEIGINYIDK